MSFVRDLARGLFHSLSQLQRRGRYGRKIRSGRIACLTTHSFTVDTRPGSLGEQPIVAFSRFVDNISREAAVARAEDILTSQTVAGAPGDRPQLLITVDDGYADNFDLLCPVLEEKGIVGTFFVTTGFIDTGTPPWPVEMRAILEAATTHMIAWPSSVDISSPSKRAALAETLKAAWAGLPHFDRADRLAELRRHARAVDVALPRPMTWPQLRAMHHAGHTIGSHTVYHGILPELGDDEVYRELRDSKDRIEAELGAPCELVAYPNGDCDRRVADLAKMVGYSTGFTQRTGWVSDREDRFSLPRINLPPYRYSASLVHRVLNAL